MISDGMIFYTLQEDDATAAKLKQPTWSAVQMTAVFEHTALKLKSGVAESIDISMNAPMQFILSNSIK